MRSIFSTKRRPLSDPVIVHIADVEQGFELMDTSESIKELYTTIAGLFWPGPLTLIVKANTQKVPMVVTAETG